MIRNKIIILLSISCLFSHEIDAPAKWKQYYRGSYIINENDDYGFGGYFRLKRTTQYTFRDFRSYLHFIKGDSYKKIRYKSSNKFIYNPLIIWISYKSPCNSFQVNKQLKK